MLDIKFIRENPEKIKKAIQNKGLNIDIDKFLDLDKRKNQLLKEVESLRAKQNKLGKNDIVEAQKIKSEIKKIEPELEKIQKEFQNLILQIPNLPLEDVPVGLSEEENKIIKTVGQKPKFDFQPKTHWELAEKLDLIDKERAAKVAGSRFAYIKGPLVKLQWALMQFGVDVLTDKKTLAKIAKEAKLKVNSKPFVPILPPLMIKTAPYSAMDRLEPKEERYKIEGEDLWLQGSAEHVLGSMYIDEILPEEMFPIRYVGYATSFRKEAGSYGKDMEGIIRMHQFDKLEMESFTTAEESLVEHYFMIAIQEYLMQQLKLPYEVILKCTYDIGKPNARGVDINVWLPGQNKYRETHTADYMTDYQARRLQTKIKRKSGKIELIHTNDATVFSQRPLIAILENYQQKDGTIRVPKVLQKYTGFSKINRKNP